MGEIKRIDGSSATNRDLRTSTSADPRDSCNSSSGFPSPIADIILFYMVHIGNIMIALTLDRSDTRTRGGKNNYTFISTKNTAFVQQSFIPNTLKD